jgi:hypothetical protein
MLCNAVIGWAVAPQFPLLPPSLTVTSLVHLPAALSQLTVTERVPVLPFAPVTVVLRI